MNANIAFLAVPGLPVNDDGKLTSIQVICQFSILLSIVSMITGLVLIKQNAVTEGKVHSGFVRSSNCSSPNSGSYVPRI